MKLIVDCALNHSSLALPSYSALSALLAIAKINRMEMPLEAVIAEQFGLTAQPDYPLAAIAAHADGLNASEGYWLRADPVHFQLQRDSFSLSEPVPMQLQPAHAKSLISDLNQHFNADGMHFMLGDSGAWYLRMDTPPEIQTSLPSVVMDRNIYQFMPVGADASKWLAHLNEIQMLLHEHPVNHALEGVQQAPVNSVWFSGGGVLPVQTKRVNSDSMLVAANPLYQGLADYAGVESLPPDMPFTQLLAQNTQELRVAILPEQALGDAVFKRLYDVLSSRKISQLTLHLGCYEKTLILNLKPSDRFKFWRKRRPVVEAM